MLWLFLTSTISIVLLGVTYWHFKSFISDSKADMAKDLADNPFAGIAEAMMQSVQIQWGFAVLFVGAIALMASSIMSLKDIERGNYKILIKQSYKALSIDDDINKLKPKHLMIVQNSLFIIFVISGLWVAQDNIISCILFILSGALCLSEVREHLSRIGLNTPTKTLFLIIPIVLVSLVLI